MATIQVNLPVKGIFKGVPVGKESESTSGDMNNVRPVDVNEDRIRLGQRPGIDKWSTTDLSEGFGSPVVAICEVSQVTVSTS